MVLRLQQGNKSQACFQIIQVSSSVEPRMRLEKSENLPEISLSRPQTRHEQRRLWLVNVVVRRSRN